MKRIVLIFTTLIFSVLIFTTCKKEETSTLVLKVSPDTLVILDSDTLKEIFLSTQPQGKVEYTISQKPDWLFIDQLKGTIDGNIISLKIKPVKTILEEGIYIGKINIISNIAGTSDVYVKMSVKEHPILKTNISEISFPENISETELQIENSGTGILIWSISNTTKWISLSKSSGYLKKGEKYLIKIKCDRSNLDINTYTSSLTINSNTETAIRSLAISMVVPKTMKMQLSQKSILFDYFLDNNEVYLKNNGNVNFNWTSSNDNYFVLSPNSGFISKGDSAKIKITVIRTMLQSGTLNSNIFITNNENGKDTIKVKINHFINTKWILDRSIIDAEFCKETNKLIIISTNPNRLSIIDPETKQIESVNLNTTPKCVSVINVGSLAVVGHNGFITYVNLTTKTIDKEYPITCDAFDIAIADNKWTYVTPNVGQWTYLHCVNYSNGAETLHTQTGNHTIYEKSRIRFQPNSNYVYLCNTTLSSTSLEKMIIKNGTANYLYQTFDASTWGNFWFSEDGLRIFTISKKVYKTSEIQANDMVYNGSIESTNTIYWAEHSATANKIFVITKGQGYDDPTSSQIDVFNGTYLNYVTNYRFEQFLVPSNQASGKLVSAEGRYVFANKSGTKIYSIVQANKSSGLLNDWAIQNIEIQ